MNRLYIAIVSIMLMMTFFSGCVSQPRLKMPRYAQQTVESITYVDKLDIGVPSALAYAQRQNIYIKNHSLIDKVDMFLTGFDKQGIIDHETGHVFDYWMFMNHEAEWSRFNTDTYGHCCYFNEKRLERFAEDVRKTLKRGKKNNIYKYLCGEWE